MPAGPARALAEAEAALGPARRTTSRPRSRKPARALGGRARRRLAGAGGPLRRDDGRSGPGEALRDAAPEAGSRRGDGVFGRLRDAARAGERAGGKPLDDLAAELPAASGLARAIRRAAGGIAGRGGDVSLGAALLSSLPPATAAAARDRIDFEVRSGAPLDAASLDRLRGDVSGGAGAATLAWMEAASLAQSDEAAAALAVIARADRREPGRDSARSPRRGDRRVRRRRGGPGAARGGAGAVAPRRSGAARGRGAGLAAAREATGGKGGAARRAGCSADGDRGGPRLGLFWSVAAADARAGRQADAAATLAYGADTWATSALAAGLRACARRAPRPRRSARARWRASHRGTSSSPTARTPGPVSRRARRTRGRWRLRSGTRRPRRTIRSGGPSCGPAGERSPTTARGARGSSRRRWTRFPITRSRCPCGSAWRMARAARPRCCGARARRGGRSRSPTSIA